MTGYDTPVFTTQPRNPVHVVEGDNITLEWMYNFGTRSFRQLTFLRNSDALDIADKVPGDIVPYIASAYRGRLLVNVTDTYTSITFLGVKRTDSTSYSLKIVSSNRDRATSQVEISVQCKYEKQFTQVCFFLLCLFVFVSLCWSTHACVGLWGRKIHVVEDVLSPLVVL